MPRTVKEWIGKTDDSMPSQIVRLRIFERWGGRCRLTGKKIEAGDKWDLDHIVPLADGGENRESNLAPVLRAAHKQKTAQENKARAKVRRIKIKHFGMAAKVKTKFKRRLDETDCRPENLKCWCQRCHLTYDAKHHAETARRTRRAKLAIYDMFEKECR